MGFFKKIIDGLKKTQQNIGFQIKKLFKVGIFNDDFYENLEEILLTSDVAIAQELGSRGIRANAIAPGFIMTAMTDALSEEVKAEWCKKIPLRRGGTPEDVANIATFLASDMSSYVSGQVIQVDGGMNM